MENASKALIIAGAILISILLIGLGVYIYNQSQTTVSQANLDSEIAQAQNQKFEAYKGNAITAAQVKQLLSLINTNNITSTTSEDYKTIGVRFGYKASTTATTLTYLPSANNTYSTDVSSIATYIHNGSTYKVSIPGVSTYDAVKNGKDGFGTASTSANSMGARTVADNKAYYSNGYIRLILIEENKG